MAGTMFRGTNVEQDSRWGRMDKKLLTTMEKNGAFAPILETKVDLKKINIDIMSKWVTERIVQLLGFEDEIVINLIINMLNSQKALDPKRMQVDITGFLEKKAGAFMEELWTLLCDAQDQPSGIPSVFLEKKKEEILRRKQHQTDGSESTSNSRPTQRPQLTVGSVVNEEIKEEKRESGRSKREGNSFDRRRPIRRSRSRNRSRSRERYGNRDRSRERYRERESDRSRNQSDSSRRTVGRSRSRERERARSRRSPSPSSSSSSSSSSRNSHRRSPQNHENRKSTHGRSPSSSSSSSGSTSSRSRSNSKGSRR